MITWHEGSTYPNPEALVKIFQSKKHDCAKSTTRYIAAALILTAALLFASREWTVVLGGLITVAFILTWMILRWRSYDKTCTILETRNFSWAAGRVQNLWKRQMLDFGGGPMYQIALCDEWAACDMTTHNQAVIGKLVVLIRDGESSYGVMIPENQIHNAIKRIARAAS